ncbi:MAG: tetratricopeptide repeat protein [candidate division Zixibacteria bacterium]|nr:tetratricopeptide repeat protein [candidate division Zixibacteria bacterium]
MKHLFYIFIYLLLSVSFVVADDFTDLVGKGNKAVTEGDYQTALDYYHQAEVERPETPELEYNMAGALYHDEKYEEAVDKLQKSLVLQDANKEASAHYNLGSVYYRMGDFQNAIQSYQRSLELIPEDIDAKYNLELARKMLKEQMKPENKDQQEQEQQEQKKQEQQEEEQEEQQDQQQQQEEQNNEEENKEQQPQPQEQSEDEMSKEDAERILNALKDDEKELQKDQERFKAKGNYQGNDW